MLSKDPTSKTLLYAHFKVIKYHFQRTSNFEKNFFDIVQTKRIWKNNQRYTFSRTREWNNSFLNMEFFWHLIFVSLTHGKKIIWIPRLDAVFCNDRGLLWENRDMSEETAVHSNESAVCLLLKVVVSKNFGSIEASCEI